MSAGDPLPRIDAEIERLNLELERLQTARAVILEIMGAAPVKAPLFTVTRKVKTNGAHPPPSRRAKNKAAAVTLREKVSAFLAKQAEPVKVAEIHKGVGAVTRDQRQAVHLALYYLRTGKGEVAYADKKYRLVAAPPKNLAPMKPVKDSIITQIMHAMKASDHPLGRAELYAAISLGDRQKESILKALSKLKERGAVVHETDTDQFRLAVPA